MKTRNILLSIIACLLLGNCDNDSEIQPSAEIHESLNLTAPNGEKIATDLQTLTKAVNSAIEKNFKEDKDIRITEIDYHATSVGFIAEIKYVTYDGYSNNAILTNALDNRIFKRINTQSESTGVYDKVLYTCTTTEQKQCPNCSVVKSESGIKCYCDRGNRKYCELTETKLN